jgi:GntR family transcriptional regulator/MocR family aminotransferase
MVKTWANYGDLHLDLTGSKVRSKLESALREAVQSGRLHPGTKLPPSRVLATDLGIARNTVADAYGQLVAEGWLTAHAGSGTWVSQRPGRPPEVGATPAAVTHPRFDLRAGVPDLAAFPRGAWQAAARKVLGSAGHHLLGYPDPAGLPELRMALADYLARVRGVTASPERVVVCGGFTHAIALLSQVLRARGARALAVEAYGHDHHRRVVAGNGLRPLPLPVDDGGARPDGLAGARQARVGAAVLTPAHQFPLGVTLLPERRRAFAEWAGKAGGFVIEDDYDGEFRYDRQPVGAMQALAPEHVVYAGTASKSLVPGLQLGWLVVPVRLRDELIAAKEASGSLVSALDQLTLAEFIGSGAYDRQIRHARLAYRRRRDRLVAMLRQQAPEVAVTGISAGLQALVRLPAGWREAEVVASAARRGVAVSGLAGYRAAGPAVAPASHPVGNDQKHSEQEPAAAGHGRGGQPVQALVVGYARPPEHAFTAALARLCAVLAITGHHQPDTPR